MDEEGDDGREVVLRSPADQELERQEANSRIARREHASQMLLRAMARKAIEGPEPCLLNGHVRILEHSAGPPDGKPV
jgi:hypothetical protein